MPLYVPLYYLNHGILTPDHFWHLLVTCATQVHLSRVQSSDVQRNGQACYVFLKSPGCQHYLKGFLIRASAVWSENS